MAQNNRPLTGTLAILSPLTKLQICHSLTIDWRGGLDRVSVMSPKENDLFGSK